MHAQGTGRASTARTHCLNHIAAFVLEGERHSIRESAGKVDVDRSIRPNSNGARVTASAPPSYKLADWRNEGLFLDEPSDQASICLRSVGKTKRRRQIGMPDSRPKAVGPLTRFGERDAVVGPSLWIFDVLVFTHCAIHPDERHFVESDGAVARWIPDVNYVCDTEPETITVSEADGRIELESGFVHRAVCFAWLHAQIMLPHAANVAFHQA